MHFPNLIRAITFTVLPLVSTWALASESNSPGDSTVLPTIESNEHDNGIVARWSVNEKWLIEGRIDCKNNQDDFFDWPHTPTCEGSLALHHKNYKTDREIFMQKIINEQRGQDIYIHPKLRFNGQDPSWPEFFEQLHSNRSTVLHLDQWPIRLQPIDGFDVSAQVSRRGDTIRKQQAKIIASRVAALLALLVGIFFTYKLLTQVAKQIRAKAPLAQSLIDSYLKRRNDAQIHRTVLDETIRIKTRESLIHPTEAEKSALRAQIKAAVDSGNHDLVKVLAGLLEKLEK